MKKCLPALLIFCIIACFCACSSNDTGVSSAIPQNEGSSSQIAENDSTSETVSNIVSHPGNIQNPESEPSKPESDTSSPSQTASDPISSEVSSSVSSNTSSQAGTSSSAASTPVSSKPTIIYTPSKNPVPSGCTYKTASGLTLVAGSMMPKEVANGDRFEDADYIYCYNRVCDPMFNTDNWFEDKNAPEGWSVVVKDCTKTSYGAIRKNINDKDVTSLYNTFLACTSLVSAPEIPETVISMYSTFTMCEALTTAPKIPEGVTNMSATFLGCEKLKTAPKIPQSVRNMSETFKSCFALTSAPVIPEAVTNMSATFYQCRALKSATRIPERVLDMSMTFYECPLLEGEIVIDALPLYYDDCFKHTEKKIILTGKSEFLPSLQKTSVAGNIEIKE